jgi:hypothetical protein
MVYFKVTAELYSVATCGPEPRPFPLELNILLDFSTQHAATFSIVIKLDVLTTGFFGYLLI